ncbi:MULTISPECIES: NAD(P)/FAD-dependent oxidoreductase [unclassified Gordonia (in: high G+C Gram-positive bacteria)]|uniref:NAD(P)/FAD-dependent oxidoreductase n=1 Tax=unclassified Gordonia (in: high G+C Gram-positive bacteria) TaxID=2657482 RepID=UPI001EF0763E|nr:MULTISPECIES: FAD-dependent monooxygenase [unclassified Gordonia (in: high G+C Gram-positive bacteria)]MCT1355780.1 FAD-dependent monooxygenase [Gordonia sp. p3-SID1431]
MSVRTEKFDAVIVGARCAGTATAIALASRGLRVLLIDSARFPSDTLSTHLLWPSTMAEIHTLGALPDVEDAGAPRLPTAEAALDDIGWRTTYSPVSGIDYAMCLRRSHLDAALQRTAVAAGADLRQLCRATSLIWTDGRAAGVVYVDEDEHEHRAVAPVVIGADGRTSMVARAANAQIPLVSTPSGRSCYFAYWTDPRTELRHIASQWRVGGLLGTAFPCDGGHTLCLLQPPIGMDGEFRGRRVTDAYLAGVAALPGLARRLDGAEMTSRVRSCTGIESYFRRSSGPGWALPATPGTSKIPSPRKESGMPTGTAACSAKNWHPSCEAVTPTPMPSTPPPRPGRADASANASRSTSGRTSWRPAPHRRRSSTRSTAGPGIDPSTPRHSDTSTTGRNRHGRCSP